MPALDCGLTVFAAMSLAERACPSSVIFRAASLEYLRSARFSNQHKKQKNSITSQVIISGVNTIEHILSRVDLVNVLYIDCRLSAIWWPSTILAALCHPRKSTHIPFDSSTRHRSVALPVPSAATYCNALTWGQSPKVRSGKLLFPSCRARLFWRDNNLFGWRRRQIRTQQDDSWTTGSLGSMWMQGPIFSGLGQGQTDR